MFQILVVEDDAGQRAFFCTVLSNGGYTPIPAPDGVAALNLLERSHIDLVISDVVMPGVDGIELLRNMRDVGDLRPVMLVTAKGDIADKREGFKAGADDYMVKPVNPEEMLLRVEALLRRSRSVSQRILKVGNTTLNCDTLTVTSGDRVTELSQKEFYLLFKLAAAPGHIFTRRQIMDEVWGGNDDGDTHTLDVHINRLRDRVIKENEDFRIVTIRGLGYKLVPKN